MNYSKNIYNTAITRMAMFCLSLFVAGIFVSPVYGSSYKKQKRDPITIYGEITSTLGVPVMGAVISVQESMEEAISDEMGYFSIDVPALKSVIVIEADGFDRFTYVVLDDTRLRVILKESVEGQSIKDKVNMPWMTTDKRSVTASVSTITNEELRKSPVMRLSQALSGRLPGLMVVSGSAFPGYENDNWYIRGMRTLINGGMNTMEKGGDGSAIVVVDGFERSFNDFDASEIETFSILKDAAATAIYGPRAANGVILVTTKRGQENRRTINVEVSSGIVAPMYLPEFLPADQYAKLHNEARINDGLTPLYSDTDIQKYRDGSDPLSHPNVDYYKEFVKPMTHQTKGALSLSGGNRIVKYFISLAYNNQGGLYNRINESPTIETKLSYSRYNLRSNFDVQISKRLSASFNLAGRIEDRRNPYVSGNTIFDKLSRYPSNAFPLEFMGIDPNLNQEIHMLGGNSIYTTSPLGDLSYKGDTEDTRRYYQLGAILKYDFDFITKGLKFNFEFNTDGYNIITVNKYRNYLVWNRVIQPDGSIRYTSFNTETSLTRAASSSTEEWSGLNANFTYNRTFGDHSVDGLLMYKNFTSSYPMTFNQPNRKVEDYVFRGNYSYKNRYFLEATVSYSGTDNFYLTNMPRFVFPAVSGAWIVSDEPWMKNDFMEFLKIRASWGITGNDQYTFQDMNGYVYRFPYRDRWWTQTQQHCWGIARTWVPYVTREGVVPNMDFTIEKSNMVNIGLDARLFGRRLSLSGDFFMEKRYDIYTRGAGSIPLALGVLDSNLPIMNNGQVNSKGFEISLGWSDNVGSDFAYWANGYVDYSTNKIVFMDEPFKTDEYRIETGGKVGQNFGLIALGLFKNQEDIDNHATQMFGPYKPGDIKYADLNKDGVVDANDYTAIGGTVFPNLGFALDMGIRYKNFDLSALFQGTSGMSHYLNNNAVRAFYNNGNISSHALGRYTDEASWATATYPRLTTLSNDNNWRISTYWLRNATYLRLKNLEVGYNLPEKSARKIGMHGLRIFFNAYNLFSIDNLDGLNPEEPAAAVNKYPQVQIFNLGLNLKF